MPSVKKNIPNSAYIIPKVEIEDEEDLPIFATTLFESNHDSSSEFNMEFSSPLDVVVPLDYTQDLLVPTLASDNSTPTRRRERLDHLSQEEKLLRRKIKNRVAAQSARDRKKARMSELEAKVVKLEIQKKRILMENYELQLKNMKLEEENRELRKRLCVMTLQKFGDQEEDSFQPILGSKSREL